MQQNPTQMLGMLQIVWPPFSCKLRTGTHTCKSHRALVVKFKTQKTTLNHLYVYLGAIKYHRTFWAFHHVERQKQHNTKSSIKKPFSPFNIGLSLPGLLLPRIPRLSPRGSCGTKTLSAMTSFLNVTGRRGRLVRPAYLVSRSSHTSGIRVRDYMCNSQHAAFYHKSSFLLRSVAKTEKACGKMRTTDWREWIANVTTLKTKTKKRLSVEISS